MKRQKEVEAVVVIQTYYRRYKQVRTYALKCSSGPTCVIPQVQTGEDLRDVRQFMLPQIKKKKTGNIIRAEGLTDRIYCRRIIQEFKIIVAVYSFVL